MPFNSAEVLGAAYYQWDQTITETDTNCTTLTEVSGSNRYLVIAVHCGYTQANDPGGRGDSMGPASMTVGGQTVNLVVDGSNSDAEGNDDNNVAVYAANETTIAAMTFTTGEATWSITWGHASPYLRIVALWYTDINQASGVVDSDHSVATDTTPDITLTTASGDYAIAVGATRGNSTLTTSDTSRNTGNSGAADSLHCLGLISEKTASGTSTTIEQTTGTGVFTSMVALVLRPAAASGGQVVTTYYNHIQ